MAASTACKPACANTQTMARKVAKPSRCVSASSFLSSQRPKRVVIKVRLATQLSGSVCASPSSTLPSPTGLVSSKPRPTATKPTASLP